MAATYCLGPFVDELAQGRTVGMEQPGDARRVDFGELWWMVARRDQDNIGLVKTGKAGPSPGDLTPRELEILKLLAQGRKLTVRNAMAWLGLKIPADYFSKP